MMYFNTWNFYFMRQRSMHTCNFITPDALEMYVFVVMIYFIAFSSTQCEISFFMLRICLMYDPLIQQRFKCPVQCYTIYRCHRFYQYGVRSCAGSLFQYLKEFQAYLSCFQTSAIQQFLPRQLMNFHFLELKLKIDPYNNTPAEIISKIALEIQIISVLYIKQIINFKK